MMNSLVVKATAAVTVLAAGSYYISAPALLTRFLSSPLFLWVAANVIIVWLLSSFRRRSSDAAADTSSSVLRAVDDLYPASDYEGYYSSSGSGFCSSAEAPVAASRPPRRQQVRDATRTALAARRTDRARVPPLKKPAGDAAARTEAWETRAPDAAGDDKKSGGEVTPTTRAVAARPEDDDDVSLDSLWQSMLQRRAVRPVAVRKSETWGNEELPRLQRAAETAAARRREMRKSVSSAAPPLQAQAAATPASAVKQLGWRTRDVLVRAQDDLLRRAESLIRRHHEQLRLQRQESEQRQAMERQRGRQALIRV